MSSPSRRFVDDHSPVDDGCDIGHFAAIELPQKHLRNPARSGYRRFQILRGFQKTRWPSDFPSPPLTIAQRLINVSRQPLQRFFHLAIALFFVLPAAFSQTKEWPDIRTVEPDLKVPPFSDSLPAAGQRVRRMFGGSNLQRIYHTLFLPSDWAPDKSFPIIVEYAGNGGYRDAHGDECTGRPEDCSLGYGLAEGRDFLWICLPYLNNAGDDLAITWWGNSPEYSTRPTLDYCQAAIDDACENFGGDRERIILCGFSRGAIACNYLGLHDDKIAKLWKAFVVCSHYDGVRPWPYRDSDSQSAALRLARLQGRPQFIIGERNQTDETRDYLLPLKQSNLTFASTGFRNHSDQWILRPSPAREQLRVWLKQVLQKNPE